jgi:hypothetical protein
MCTGGAVVETWAVDPRDVGLLPPVLFNYLVLAFQA